MSAFEAGFTVTHELAAMHRTLRPSGMLRLMQSAAVAHTEALGMGREKTFDKGLLWAVTRQYAEIARMPVYGETVTLRTWPGKTMHVLFPRYCEFIAENGETLIRTSSVWVLVDEKTRRFAFPEEHGVHVEGVTTGTELPLPPAPAPLPETAHTAFTVPYSYVDINGHMNNARYLDVAEDVTPCAAEGRPLASLSIEYKQEARLHEALLLTVGSDGGGRYSVCGSTDKTSFLVDLNYR